MKRIIARMMAALLAVILLFSSTASAISAKSAIVLDGATERIVYAKDIHTKRLIASTTKIMTALLICENCHVLEQVKIPKEAVGIEGSSLYLQQGEVLTVQELLYGLMLHSGNDAATALAIYCEGSVEKFVERMNEKAGALGLKNTHFQNPHGLDGDSHYSTAADLGKLAVYAMKNPIFAKTVSTKMVRIGQRFLKNHNKLLWQLDGADGIKTGYTRAAGRILASSAVQKGKRLVAVTMSAPDDWNDHVDLLKRGFQEYQEKKVIQEGQVLGRAEIAGGTEKSVELIAKESWSYPLVEGETVEILLPTPGFVYAPVAEGQDAGDAQLYIGRHRIGRIPLLYGKTIEQQREETSYWKKIWEVIRR